MKSLLILTTTFCIAFHGWNRFCADQLLESDDQFRTEMVCYENAPLSCPIKLQPVRISLSKPVLDLELNRLNMTGGNDGLVVRALLTEIPLDSLCVTCRIGFSRVKSGQKQTVTYSEDTFGVNQSTSEILIELPFPEYEGEFTAEMDFILFHKNETNEPLIIPVIVPGKLSVL